MRSYWDEKDYSIVDHEPGYFIHEARLHVEYAHLISATLRNNKTGLNLRYLVREARYLAENQSQLFLPGNLIGNEIVLEARMYSVQKIQTTSGIKKVIAVVK